MKGFPKNLNTKEDYEYVRLNFPKEMWEKSFQALLDTQYNWYIIGELGATELGIEDETHKVEKDDEAGKCYQFEYKLNPNSKLLSLGYSENEVKKILEN